jgi:hypothetical protein
MGQVMGASPAPGKGGAVALAHTIATARATHASDGVGKGGGNTAPNQGGRLCLPTLRRRTWRGLECQTRARPRGYFFFSPSSSINWASLTSSLAMSFEKSCADR